MYDTVVHESVDIITQLLHKVWSLVWATVGMKDNPGKSLI